MRVSHDSLLVFRLIFREAVHSLYHRIVQSAEHCTRLSENRGCKDEGSIPSPCGNTLTLIYHFMKDSFKKIQSLADELAKNADVANGGDIIILATNPNSEEGESNTLQFMKGKGIDLIATLTTVFRANDSLRKLVQHALFMSLLIPKDMVQKSE